MIRILLPAVLLPIILSVSCAGPVLIEQPSPTTELITVALDPDLLPMVKAIQVCSDEHPGMIVAVQETSPAFQEWAAYDLFIRLGEPDETLPFAAPIGIERVVVVLNASNPLATINAKEIEDIFSGRLSRWSDIKGPAQPIQVWTYPEGYATKQAFDQAFMSGSDITSNAMLTPNAAAMLEAISNDPNAIGFIPRAWSDESVKVVRVDHQMMDGLHIPLLAISVKKPVGAAANLLYCLQQGAGMAEILRLYEKQ
jgi:DNA-binding transcriptional LysR family regulator